MTWRTLRLPSIAVAILAGCWLLWQSLTLAEPVPAIAPPPISTRSFVRPVSPLPMPTHPPFVSYGTPVRTLVTEPCLASWEYRVLRHLRHLRCPRSPLMNAGYQGVN